jgi:type IV pilus assembly protein PilW
MKKMCEPVSTPTLAVTCANVPCPDVPSPDALRRDMPNSDVPAFHTTHQHFPPPGRAQRTRSRGLGLIEFMIAITLGMLIMLAIVRLYMASLDAQQSESDVAQLSDSARAAFDVIGAAVRKAGYRSPFGTGTPLPVFCGTPAASSMPTTGPTVLGKNAPGVIDPADPVLGGSTVTLIPGSDVLRIRYFGGSTTDDAAVRDCLGNAVATGALVEDTFYVANDSANANQPALFCHSMVANATPPLTAGTAAPLAAGVETLQLLYGEDTDGDGVVNRYLPWNTGTTIADNLLSIKVALVIRASSQGNVSRTSNFALFGPNYAAIVNADPDANVNITSGHLRKMFDAEIALRNPTGCGAP